MECGPGSETLVDPYWKPCQNGVNSVYKDASAGEWDYLSPWSPPLNGSQLTSLFCKIILRVRPRHVSRGRKSARLAIAERVPDYDDCIHAEVEEVAATG
jgi:hypothetical protein